MSDTWETFCDESYYHLWRVRRKSERNFDDGYHLQQGEEARALVVLLNRLEAERDEAIRQRDETNESSVFSCNFYYEEKLKAERERDEARQLACLYRDQYWFCAQPTSVEPPKFSWEAAK